MNELTILYGENEITDAINKISDMILEELMSGDNPREFVLVGIFKQGVPLAKRMKEVIFKKSGFNPELAELDISLYRDDFGMRSALPIIHETTIPFDMNGARIILVDDVFSTGRTIRAALDAITDYGRPKSIRLAALIDRNNSEYPIKADYVGINLKIEDDKKILVQFKENDGIDSISIRKWHKK